MKVYLHMYSVIFQSGLTFISKHLKFISTEKLKCKFSLTIPLLVNCFPNNLIIL